MTPFVFFRSRRENDLRQLFRCFLFSMSATLLIPIPVPLFERLYFLQVAEHLHLCLGDVVEHRLAFEPDLRLTLHAHLPSPS